MSPVGTLRQELRIRTRAAHDALDRSLDLIGRPLTLTQYRRLLARFHGVHRAVEPLLAWHLEPALLEGRGKLSAIEHDLLDCGLAKSAIHALPSCDLLPPVDSMAAALAALYVIEGSTLGGRVIARSLHRNPEILPQACRYFEIYGTMAGIRWHAVCNALEQHDDPVTTATATTTAVAIFNGLEMWLHPRTWRDPATTDGGRDRD